MNNTKESYFNFSYTYIPQYIICLFGVISHLFLLAAFIKDPLKCFRTSGIYFVASLAVSDFLVCVLGSATLSATDKTGFLQHVTNASYCVSVITIFSISLDRYIMISHPIRHRLLMGGKLMAGWIALTWLLGAVYFLTQLIFGITEQDGIIRNCLISLTIVFAVGLYSRSYFALKKQSKNISQQNSTDTIASRNQVMRILKEQRFLTTIILIASIAFVSVVLPVSIFQVFLSLELSESERNVLVGIVTPIYYFNFAINPFIYFIRLPNYRKTFSYLFLRKQF